MMPVSRNVLATLAATGLLAVVAGCADTPRMSASERARASVEVFLEACASGEGARAVEILTRPTRETFLAASDVLAACSSVLGTGGVESAATFRAAEVREVSVHAGTGEARIALPASPERQVDLHEVHGRWLLANPPPSTPR